MKLNFTRFATLFCVLTLSTMPSFGQSSDDGRPPFVPGQMIVQTEEVIDLNKVIALSGSDR